MAFAEQTPEFTLKIILLGDSSVGKTCLLERYISGEFSPVGQTTVGVGYGAKNIEVRGGRTVRLQIWDTVTLTQAGQEAFRSITRSFYRGANAACVVYSIASKSSFQSIEKWIEDLRIQSGSETLIYLLGNMSDLNERREVDTKAGKSLADRLALTGFYEVSAKTGDNVTAMFGTVAEATFLNVWRQQPQDDQSQPEINNLVANLTQSQTKPKSSCCK